MQLPFYCVGVEFCCEQRIQWPRWPLLQDNDFRSLWAFLTWRDDELYALAFLQSFETCAGDFAEMGENIWA